MLTAAINSAKTFCRVNHNLNSSSLKTKKKKTRPEAKPLFWGIHVSNAALLSPC